MANPSQPTSWFSARSWRTWANEKIPKATTVAEAASAGSLLYLTLPVSPIAAAVIGTAAVSVTKTLQGRDISKIVPKPLTQLTETAMGMVQTVSNEVSAFVREVDDSPPPNLIPTRISAIFNRTNTNEKPAPTLEPVEESDSDDLRTAEDLESLDDLNSTDDDLEFHDVESDGDPEITKDCELVPSAPSTSDSLSPAQPAAGFAEDFSNFIQEVNNASEPAWLTKTRSFLNPTNPQPSTAAERLAPNAQPSPPVEQPTSNMESPNSVLDSIRNTAAQFADAAGELVEVVQSATTDFIQEVNEHPEPALPFDIPSLQFNRPLNIDGRNRNPLCPPVTDEIRRTTELINQKISEIRNDPKYGINTSGSGIIHARNNPTEESPYSEVLPTLTMNPLPSKGCDASSLDPIEPNPIAMPNVLLFNRSSLNRNLENISGPHLEKRSSSPSLNSLPSSPRQNTLSSTDPLPPDLQASSPLEQVPNQMELPPIRLHVDQPAAVPLTPQEKTEEMRQKTNEELEKFIENLTSYATLQILHEWIAGAKPPNPDLYRQMVLEVRGSNGVKPSLWEVYNRNLGKDLTFFQKAKAAICYFIFYFTTGLIPNMIETFTKNIVNTFRNDISDHPALKSLTSKILTYAEKFLVQYKAATELFLEENGRNGSLEEYQQRAVNRICDNPPDQLDAEVKFDHLFTEVSTVAVDQFYQQVELFKKWKNNRIAPVRWVANILAFFLEAPINWIIKLVLKKRVLPAVLKTLDKTTITTSDEKTLLLSRSLYQTATEQLGKILEKINEEGPREPLPELAGAEKLPTVAKLMVKVLNMTPYQIPDELRKFINEHGSTEDTIREGMEEGMQDAARIGLGILHNPDNIEEIFSKILSISNVAFEPSEDYETLRQDNKRWLNKLNCEAKRVFDAIIQRSIQEKLDASFKPAAAQTQAIYCDVQNQILKICEQFNHVSQVMACKIASSEENPAQICRVLADVKKFCGLMDDFLHQTNIQDKPDTIPGMNPAVREGLERTLKPILKEALSLMESIGHLAERQTWNTAYSEIELLFIHVRSLLEKIDGSLSNGVDQQVCDTFECIQEQYFTFKNYFYEDNFAKTQLESHICGGDGLEPLGATLEKIRKNQNMMRNLDLLAASNGLVMNLIKSKQGIRIEGFNPAKATNEVKEILNQLPEEEKKLLTASIVQMQTHISSKESTDWATLKSFILEQTPADLREKAASLIDEYFSRLPRGKYVLTKGTWNRIAHAFREDLPTERCSELDPLLEQIQQFIVNNNILAAYWRHFKQQISSIRQPYEAQSKDSEQTYCRNSENLRKLAADQIPKYDEARRFTHRQMLDHMGQIQMKLAELKQMAIKFKPEEGLQLRPLVSGGLGLAGAAAGVAMSMMGVPWPVAAGVTSAASMFATHYYKGDGPQAALKGAAMGMAAAALPIGPLAVPLVAGVSGAAAGYQVPEIVQGYGNTVIFPAVQQILKNVVSEGVKAPVHRGILYMALDAFAKSYSPARR